MHSPALYRKPLTPAIIAGVLLSCTASLSLAQHAGDIYLERNYENRICTARVDQDSGVVVHNTRVFAAEFGESPNFTNDPGMDSEVGTFAPGTSIGFTIRKALRKWGGADFDLIPPEQISIRLATLGPVLTPMMDTPVTGFAMPVSSAGEFHRHPGFTLTSPAGTGVYLLELELWSTEGGVAASYPYWIVFNQNDSEVNHTAAIEWARSNLVGCPSDFDASGFSDTDDFDAFVRAYEAGDFTADVDGTGFVDTDDFDFFVRAFESGC